MIQIDLSDQLDRAMSDDGATGIPYRAISFLVDQANRSERLGFSLGIYKRHSKAWAEEWRIRNEQS